MRLLLAAFLLALGTSGASACAFMPGDYLTSTLDAEPKPYLVLEVSEASGCIIDYREPAAPAADAENEILSMFEEFLLPYEGPVANANGYGCRFQSGQAADYEVSPGEWRPALVQSSGKDCTYVIDYFEAGLANPATIGRFDGPLLRASALALPSEDEQAAAMLCPPAGALEDFADDSVDSAFKRAIIADANARFGEPVSVYFDRIRYGQTAVVVDGGTFHANNPDAALGTDILPFRLDARVCNDSSGRPEITSRVWDYNCFTDKFGDFTCRLEAER